MEEDLAMFRTLEKGHSYFSYFSSSSSIRRKQIFLFYEFFAVKDISFEIVDCSRDVTNQLWK